MTDTDEMCRCQWAAWVCAGCARTLSFKWTVLGRVLCGDCYSRWSLAVEDFKREVLRRLCGGT